MRQSESTSKVRVNPSENKVQSQTHLADRLGDRTQFRIVLGTNARTIPFDLFVVTCAVPVCILGVISSNNVVTFEGKTLPALDAEYTVCRGPNRRAICLRELHENQVNLRTHFTGQKGEPAFRAPMQHLTSPNFH